MLEWGTAVKAPAGAMALRPQGPWTPNLVLDRGRDLQARGLAMVLNCLLVEFSNQPDDTTAVTPPTPIAADQLAYFDALPSNRDWLRVPAAVVLESTDPLRFQGNRLRFQGMTSATTGVRGLPFGPAHHSRCYGVHLAQAVDWSNRHLDVVYNRAYETGTQQLLAPSGPFTAYFVVEVL